jgi:hypothetical protein
MSSMVADATNLGLLCQDDSERGKRGTGTWDRGSGLAHFNPKRQRETALQRSGISSARPR